MSEENKLDWNSTNLIGRVKERYNEIFRPDRRWNVWRGFYNGWIEGRTDMIIQNKKDVDNQKAITSELVEALKEAKTQLERILTQHKRGLSFIESTDICLTDISKALSKHSK